MQGDAKRDKNPRQRNRTRQDGLQKKRREPATASGSICVSQIKTTQQEKAMAICMLLTDERPLHWAPGSKKKKSLLASPAAFPLP
jgi:hypothetical protein